MNKKTKKLTLNRDTVRSLSPQALQAANGGILSTGCHFTLQVSCVATCNLTCGCPTLAGDCTDAC